MTPDEFFGALEHMPKPQPVFYRLYYDKQGRPLFYSMEDQPGTYIEITQQQYTEAKSNIRVRNGSIVELTWQTAEKITPGNSGTLCHTRDVAVVVNKNGTYWSKKTYETS